MKSVKKKRKCGKCGIFGLHNRRTCGKNNKNVLSCNLCGENHIIDECPIIAQTIQDDVKIKRKKQQIIYNSFAVDKKQVKVYEKNVGECSICLEIMSIDNAVYMTCFHMLHKNCRDAWFTHSKVCPICRLAQ